MSFKLVACNRVAHLVPTLNGGSIATNYYKGTVCTLDPNAIVQGTNPDWVWDRGTGSKNAVNALVLVNHNLKVKSSTVTVYAHASTNPPTTSLGSITPSDNRSVYQSLTSNDERYIRAYVTGTAVEIGVLSIGTAYDLGNAQFGGQVGHSPSDNPTHGGGRTFSYSFGKVTTANCAIIARLMAVKNDIEGTTSQSYDGLGGNGGQAFVALANDDDEVIWGRASFSYQEYSPTLSRAQVQITEASYLRNV